MLRDDWDEAWSLTDEPFRLAQVQAWLWPQRGEPDLVNQSLDDVAASICDEGPAHPLWEDFAEVVIETYHQTWREFDLGRWGVTNGPRATAPGYEVIVYSREEEAVIPTDETLYVARPFLMHLTAGRWLVAHAGSNRLPVPGWPPEFPDASWGG